VMNVHESRRLAELEKMIAKGKQTFVEVGLALAEIRDLRLYKREYGSFSEYCREKWGWNKSYAYYMIHSAEVVKALPEKVSTIVDSEGVARELAKVEPEQRAGIVQAVVDEGKPVTAAAIKRHLPPPPMRRRAPGGTNGAVPPPPGQVLDATGWPIPTQLIPLWQRAGEVQEWLTVLSRLKGVLRSAQEKRDMLFAEVQVSAALSQAEQLWTDMKTAKPFAVCPTCQGQVPDKCTLCRGRGLISEFRWNTCVTREDKQFREKAKSGKLKR
ncbi:MAG: hypothetical protein NT167_28365, partial [Verrucomicrobia bacterium]|nr:hypothetical protein [Verrucomicrobiota bacterium]